MAKGTYEVMEARMLNAEADMPILSNGARAFTMRPASDAGLLPGQPG